jgi:galactitol-specific phosphotransferase system IIB component
MCWFNGKIHEVTNDELNDEFELDSVYISELDTNCPNSDAIVVTDDCAPWIKMLQFCGSSVSFKIDTGADITVISKTLHDSLENRPPLIDQQNCTQLSWR